MDQRVLVRGHNRAPGRGRIYDSIAETIGDTPIVRLDKLARMYRVGANLLAKLEFFNPISSVKDRIGLYMIESMEREGKIQPGKTVLIEPTSGNTGIALAFVAAALGYRLILVMPESMSVERRKMLALLGAKVVLDSGRAGHERHDPQSGGASYNHTLLRHAPAIREPGKSRDPSCVQRPRKSGTTPTAPSTWLFAAWARAARSQASDGGSSRETGVKMIAVEPAESPVLSGGRPGLHKIQGIGTGFFPSCARPRGDRRGRDGAQPERHRDGPPGGAAGRHSGWHLFWCGYRRGDSGRFPPRERGQEHRDHRRLLRRALFVDSAVRRALTARRDFSSQRRSRAGMAASGFERHCGNTGVIKSL